MRELQGWTKKIVMAITATTSLFHLYTAATGILEPRLQRGFHLLFLIPLAYLLFPMTRRSPRNYIPWYDWMLAALSALPSLYIILFRDVLNERWEGTTQVTILQIVLGFIIVGTLIEAVRRSTAPALAILMGLAVIHLAFGHLMPGLFYHKKFSLDWIIERSYLLQEEGIYGAITGVSAVFVALFVIFGAFIHGLGLGQYFIDLAFRIAGRAVGGPAKVAVLASCFFGMISGSATANVFTTGTFTIPLMRRIGYRPRFAGAVEAAASTGGQIMPPIMGASAFLMAQITQIPYIAICKAALPAAILYFLCIGLTVHFEALKRGLKGSDPGDVVPGKHLLRDSYLLLPVLGLLFLLILGFSPFLGAFLGVLISLAVSYVDRSRWMTPAKILKALDMGARNLVMIACACAGAGLIISVVVNTGLGLRFSNLVISYSMGNYLWALFFIMISAIILGMGLPPTAAYVLAVSVGGPTLIEMGGDMLSVHMFVFYFAILAAITPPVALAAYAGASLAKSSFMGTGFEASRIAVAGYIVPYLFYYNPGILLQGSLITIFLSLATAVLGIFMLIIATQGWLISPVAASVRILLGAGAIVIIFPALLSNLYSVVGGTMLIALLYLFQRTRRKRVSTAHPFSGGSS